MKTKLIAILLLAGSSLFAGPRVSVAFGFGGYGGYGYGGYYVPAPPPPVPVYAAPAPRPGFSWVGGYWYPAGARYAWRPGYWARPPYAGAYWVGPRYYGRRYYSGYWRR
jgi:hypothetical protein